MMACVECVATGRQPLLNSVDHQMRLHYVMDTKMGNCVGLSMLYLSLTDRPQLPFYGVVAPSHIFVRYDDGKARINVETTDRGVQSLDSHYTKLFRTAPGTLYLASLTKQQMIAASLTGG